MEKGALIGQGRTADVYTWGEDRILKLYQPWMPRVSVEQEFAISRAAAAAGIPAAATEELVAVDGRFGIIFERLSGPSMLKVMSSQPWKMFGLARQLGDLQAAIHRIKAPAGIPTQRGQIEWAIQHGNNVPEHIRAAALARLAALPEGDQLIHGDFHPDNILMTTHGPVIIDWMTGASGQPAGDVSRTLMLLTTSGLPPSVPAWMKTIINASRSLMVRRYSRRYREINAAAFEANAQWQIPVMAARLREVEGYPAEWHSIMTWLETACQSEKTISEG